MRKEISISVQKGDITRFDADVIALKYARGLFGAAFSVAKGLGKSEADMQKLLPSVGNLHLADGRGRIKARQALFLSVVQLSSFDYIEIRPCGRRVLQIQSPAPRRPRRRLPEPASEDPLRAGTTPNDIFLLDNVTRVFYSYVCFNHTNV